MKATYTIDPMHSSAHFSIRHLMISNVRGSFGKVTGTVIYDSENPAESTVEAEIDAASLLTGDEKRDGHVKSPDFLDVGQFPTITFKSTKVESDGGDVHLLGDLTMHGVTKPVVLDVDGPTTESKDPYGNSRVGVEAKTKIKRTDFGLSFNAPLETGGVMLGDELKIEIDLSLIKSA